MNETRVRPLEFGVVPEYPGAPWDVEISEEEDLTAAELALVKQFRRLSDDDRATLLRMAQALDGGNED